MTDTAQIDSLHPAGRILPEAIQSLDEGDADPRELLYNGYSKVAHLTEALEKVCVTVDSKEEQIRFMSGKCIGKKLMAKMFGHFSCQPIGRGCTVDTLKYDQF